jgi:hypothetical protein
LINYFQEANLARQTGVDPGIYTNSSDFSTKLFSPYKEPVLTGIKALKGEKTVLYNKKGCLYKSAFQE